MSRVVVDIQRVVFMGFRPEDRHALALGLRQALEQSLADPTALSHLSAIGHRRRLIARDVEVAPDAAARAIGIGVGRQIARALAGRAPHRATAPTP